MKRCSSAASSPSRRTDPRLPRTLTPARSSTTPHPQRTNRSAAPARAAATSETRRSFLPAQPEAHFAKLWSAVAIEPPLWEGGGIVADAACSACRNFGEQSTIARSRPSPSLPKRWLCHAALQSAPREISRRVMSCPTVPRVTLTVQAVFLGLLRRVDAREKQLFRSQIALPTHTPKFSPAESAISFGNSP